MLSEADKKVVISAARAAGAVHVQHHKQAKNIRKKSEGMGLVSDVDIESERVILEFLEKQFPDHNFVKEESDTIDNKSEYTWHIDPLDGTANYLHGMSMFGVSIGLAHLGKPIFGVIYYPLSDELFVAESGKGATLNGKKIAVSANASLAESLVYVGSDLHRFTAAKLKLIEVLATRVYRMRMIGCAVYDLMQTAQGFGDATLFLNIFSWDVVAGVVLVREAGGTVTDFAGKEWVVNAEGFIASNGNVHDELVSSLD
ncbi:MAG: inositol monophosphatase family protein [Nanoarchaeota archaeon]|nr:inositol monophosphatase family protein [Nanoarchaeota archaeon]